jgi:hypothetical protein
LVKVYRQSTINYTRLTEVCKESIRLSTTIRIYGSLPLESKHKNMDDQKLQLIEKLKSGANILVTVSNNPSVDQLAACIALTIALNKMDKHATAVFSGDIPETIEFLKPEETLEKNTDSLRDFIIALDKTKADKLRYKVEDKVVKIFITPYKTSISEEDLNFSQGDFNVDAVVALGVREQQDLDQAITAHGRILHDATVLGIHTQAGGELGSINWVDTNASSLSELTASLIKQLDKKLMDEQIATALLTGIVAATDRFRNENTSAQTMSVSADLMAAGANQQLVTSELEHTVTLRDNSDGNDQDSTGNDSAKKAHKPKAKTDAGTLEINHNSDQPETEPETTSFDTANFDTQEPQTELPAVNPEPTAPPADNGAIDRRDVMTEPPRFNSPLTANDKQETAPFEPSPDLGGSDQAGKLLTHNDLAPPEESVSTPPQPVVTTPPPASQPAASAVTAPAQPETPPAPTAEPSVDVEAARDEVMKALSEQPDETLPPIAALNAQPLGNSLHAYQPAPPTPEQPAPPAPQMPLTPSQNIPPASHSPADQPMDMPLPPSGGPQIAPPQPAPPTNAPDSAGNDNVPPPVPPPMTPPSWPGPQQ